MDEDKVAQFSIAISEIEDIILEEPEFKHPLLTIAKFVFADDKGNGNNQGILAEDFDEVIKTAIDMPIKMKYLGAAGAGGHPGSIPIGHIKKIEKVSDDDGNRLVAWAALYTEEFPDEIQYIREAFADKKAPGLSYEIVYRNSIVQNGIEWLKDMVVRAATFVRRPAYGNRTAILALASNKELSQDDFEKEVLALVQPEEVSDKGGLNMDEKDQKIQQLEEALALATSKQDEITALNEQIATLTTERDSFRDENTSLKTSILVSERVQAWKDAGLPLESDAEKLDKKKSFWAAMSADQFNEYLEDLKSVKSVSATAGQANAGLNGGIPKLAVAGDKEITFDDLKGGFRSLSRPGYTAPKTDE